jgi:hypothetical protein
VPLRVLLGEREAAPLQRVGNDDARPARLKGQGGEGGAQRRYVVAVHLAHGPAEGAPLIRHRRHVEQVGDWAVGLELVMIDDSDQGVEPVLGRGHRRLPHRALVGLAVAHDDEDAAVALLKAGGQRHADANRQAVAERPGGRLHAGSPVALGMAAQHRSGLGLAQQLVLREEAFIGQDGVKR